MLIDIAILIGVILVSMTLHEVMHGYVAYILGDDTAKHQGRLTLNPLKHIDPFLTIILPVVLAISGGPIFGGAKPVPLNPARLKFDEWGAALVALAGPLTNLLIAFVLYGIGVLTGTISALGIQMTPGGEILFTAIMVNLGFFVFNMIPFPPLDGSRVLYALAPEFVRRIMEVMEQFGVLLVLVIVFVASQQIGMVMGATMDFVVDAFSFIFRLD